MKGTTVVMIANMMITMRGTSVVAVATRLHVTTGLVRATMMTTDMEMKEVTIAIVMRVSTVTGRPRVVCAARS